MPPTLDIENPDPQPGTNNFYTPDGYSGGICSNCSDEAQPGVASVVADLKMDIKPNGEAGHYYLLQQLQPRLLRRRNPYVPMNSPAISDLWGAFDFGH